MKKQIYALIFFIFLLPFSIKADGIENFYINAEVQKNGDLIVEEYFNLTGSYNGFERIINYRNSDNYEFHGELESLGTSEIYNGDNINILEVKSVSVSENFNFANVDGDLFKLVKSASKGSYKKYTVDYNYDGVSTRIFLPSKKKKAFYIKYKIKNIAVSHNDVGELWWQVFSDELNESINHLIITITFPNNQNEFRVWAHGPLNGQIEKLSNNKLRATVTNLSAYQDIDIRATFDLEVIKESKKKSEIDAIQKILNYEEDAASKANYERKQDSISYEKRVRQEIEDVRTNGDRSSYDDAKIYISYIIDENIKRELTQELESLEYIVIEKEENNAIEATEFAERNYTYNYYNMAIESVKILTNEILKSQLNDRLEIVKNKIIKDEEQFNLINIIIMVILFIIIFLLCLYIYISMYKRPKSEFNEKYLRDFPSDASPAMISYLMKKRITNESISAEILDLINKKILLVEQIDNDYLFLRGYDHGYEINKRQQLVLNFIFNSDSEVKLSKFKKRAKNSPATFIKLYNNVVRKCELDAKKEDWFVENKMNINNDNGKLILIIFILSCFFPILIPMFIMILVIYYIYKKTKENNKFKVFINLGFTLIIIISIIMLILLLVLNHFVFDSFIYNLIVILLAILGIVFVSKSNKKTEKGMTEYYKWKALKNFLNDFGSMKEKKILDIVLWQKYLVYALVFGCADKLAKEMKFELANIDDNMSFNDLMYVTSISNTIKSTVSSSISSAKSSYSSSSGGGSFSSGSGGGGGFSSGSGGGGGGGGGRF